MNMVTHSALPPFCNRLAETGFGLCDAPDLTTGNTSSMIPGLFVGTSLRS